MCYDDQAKPPLPPGQAGAVHGEDIVLAASDGAQFAAFAATPETTAGHAAVLIYPDIRGLHQFYKELALHFAEVGVPALAIDYFGRTAGLTSRAEPFEFWPHVQQMRLETFSLDVHAAIDAMRERFGSDAAIVPVGFCLGGGLALMTGADRSFGFAGVVPFYAGLSRDMGGGTALERASDMTCPVLGLFGGADANIPTEQVHALDERLDASGVEHEIVIYPDAPHSFFDRRATEFAADSDDAWKRVLGFLQQHGA